MVGALEDAVLGHRVRHLVLLHDHLLFEDLDRVQLGGRLLAAQDHLAERALAEDLQELEVFQRLGEGKDQINNGLNTVVLGLGEQHESKEVYRVR